LPIPPSLGNHPIIWKLKFFVYKPYQSLLIPNSTAFRQGKTSAGNTQIAGTEALKSKNFLQYMPKNRHFFLDGKLYNLVDCLLVKHVPLLVHI
jgi:hypothetical protein